MWVVFKKKKFKLGTKAENNSEKNGKVSGNINEKFGNLEF